VSALKSSENRGFTTTRTFPTLASSTRQLPYTKHSPVHLIASGRYRRSNVVSDVKYGLITYWPGVLLASRVARQHPMEAFYECDFFGDRKSTRLNSSHVSISYAV